MIQGQNKTTLLVESFAGTNFRDFANPLVVRESLYQRNRSFQFVRESLYPQNFQIFKLLNIREIFWKFEHCESLTFFEM